MDPKRHDPLFAPGHLASPAPRLPGVHDPSSPPEWPRVDDHLVEPETRQELVRAEGREEAEEAEPLVRGVFGMLAAMRLVPTDEQRATIEACHDSDRLLRWLLSSIHARSVDELLALE